MENEKINESQELQETQHVAQEVEQEVTMAPDEDEVPDFLKKEKTGIEGLFKIISYVVFGIGVVIAIGILTQFSFFEEFGDLATAFVQLIIAAYFCGKLWLLANISTKLKELNKKLK